MKAHQLSRLAGLAAIRREATLAALNRAAVQAAASGAAIAALRTDLAAARTEAASSGDAAGSMAGERFAAWAETQLVVLNGRHAGNLAARAERRGEAALALGQADVLDRLAGEAQLQQKAALARRREAEKTVVP